MGGNKSGQRNKAHKHGKHSSKSELKEASKGRVAKLAGVSRVGPASMKGGLDAGAKLKRIQQSDQRRDSKRQELLAAKRLGRKGAPKIVGVIPIGETSDQITTRRQLQQLCETGASYEGPTTVKSSQFNQRFTFLHSTDDQQEQLDLAKVCDIIVFSVRVAVDEDIDPNAIEPDLPDDKTIQTWYSDVGLCIDDTGRQILSMINSQGLPSVCVVLQGLDMIANARKRRSVERVHLRYFKSIMTEGVVPKVFSTDTDAKAKLALRYMSEQKIREVKWRDIRPYFLAEKCEWADPEAPPTESEIDGKPVKSLAVTGWLRGKNFSANQLVHLTGYGTYQIDRIIDHTLKQEHVPNEGQESLQYCQVPDPMAGEQTWPTEEDFKAEAEKEKKKKKRMMEKLHGKQMKVAVPEGFSSYQAAWVADPAQFEELSDGEMEEGGDEQMETRSVKSRMSKYSRVSSAAQTDVENALGGEWLARDEALTDEQRAEEYMRLKEQSQEDREFPDEVDVPFHTPARMRFAKYRGLASFRSSEWDANESLPIDYARIFRFQNFRRTQKIIMAEKKADDAEGCTPGSYVTVVVKGVPLNFPEEYTKRREAPLCVSGLLKNEQKYTVLHCVMQRNREYDEPIKSKTRFVIHMGFRKVVAQPIYSDHTPSKGARTKFCRYFHSDDKFIMMSFFGPTCFTPTPALCFQPLTRAEKEGGAQMPFVSFGAHQIPEPNMMLLKKIVLTGHVYKTHKRQSIVRFMFHNEEDVKWFQPVEVYTKLGKRGRILKSVGTHGHMKVTFSDVVQGHDVVCMDLWKRVFPKWNTAAFSHLAEAPMDETSDEEESDIDMADEHMN
eukprot:TRINITY_DN2672_c3_g5_i1.p2 TRINITY_DN2672_c3_g5~~TRINITY_DN2672_c3_g5_i1.p2  ORF type:complete len:836 (+),score=387.10 TRINITY_DN2672_c3_g5_i1:75-2582(+)